jgi:integrase
MKNHSPESKPQSNDWKTVGENLVRYVPSGGYYARIRAGGKLVRKSLKTDVQSVAKSRLADLEKSLRQMTERQTDVAKGRMTFGDGLNIYRERVQGDAGLKPKTKSYYAERIKTLLKSWPQLESADIRRLSKNDFLRWSAAFAPTISAGAYNHTITILKHVMEIGVEMGARLDNPAKALARLREKSKELTLPNFSQFEKFVVTLKSGGGGFSKHCADLVQFLAFGGFRKTEAANVRWQDVDFDKGVITVKGDAETGTKNGEDRRVPIFDEMRELLERLKTEKPDAKPSEPVMEVRECQKSMNRASKEVGMARITHHDLRHLFATRCIESNVDIPTVSRWLGHKDGGALAMRVYGHLREEHSAEMAKRVKFSKTEPEPENVAAQPAPKLA